MPEKGFFNPHDIVSVIAIEPGMRVADFGSGSGEIALMFAKLTGEQGAVTAIDVLPSALESVRAKAKSQELTNISAIRANLELAWSSGLPDDSQDLVFMANILWQSSHKESILAEAVRVLKPGGVVAAVEWKPTASGFGPPADARISEDQLKELIKAARLEYTATFAAGAFHYGLLAMKPSTP